MCLTTLWRRMQGPLHRRPAQIEVAIGQPQRLVDLGLLGQVEGQRLRRIEHLGRA